MDKNNISFTEFMNDIDANYEPTTTIHWHGRDVEVKKVLDLSETLAFVSDVIDACYTSNASEDISLENANIIYAPELKKYALDYMTIAHYTNIDLMPDGEEDAIDMGSAYNFIYHSDIIEQILNVIDFKQYEQTVDSIEKKIKFINESNILEMTREFATFNNAIQELLPAIEEMSNAFDSESIIDMMGAISKMQDNNTLRELAVKTMRSGNPDIIEFAKQIGGDMDGGKR